MELANGIKEQSIRQVMVLLSQMYFALHSHVPFWAVVGAVNGIFAHSTWHYFKFEFQIEFFLQTQMSVALSYAV
jgi:hypothetical protein